MDEVRGHSESFEDLMAPLRAAIPDAVLRFKDAFEKGEKIVGAYCVYFPPELAEAVGALPVALCNTRPVHMAAAEKHLPRNLCPLIKSSYGFALEDQCPFFHFATVVVGETTCDGKKKMFEYLGKLKPVHVMQLPYQPDLANAWENWREELRRVLRFFEGEMGVTYDEGRLREAIRGRNGQRALMRRIYRASEPDPPLIRGHDIMKLTEISWYTRETGEFREKLNALADSLEFEGKAPFEKGAVRILLTGVPVGSGSDKIFEIIEGFGAAVVAQEMCSGQKTMLDDVSEEGDPLDALTDWTLSLSCACHSPNPRRKETLRSFAKTYAPDGVLDFTWVACHTYACESQSIRDFTEKELGVPYINIESDYGDADREQLSVRVGAFLEICRQRRK